MQQVELLDALYSTPQLFIEGHSRRLGGYVVRRAYQPGDETRVYSCLRRTRALVDRFNRFQASRATPEWNELHRRATLAGAP